MIVNLFAVDSIICPPVIVALFEFKHKIDSRFLIR
jgi:hypothetical protein